MFWAGFDGLIGHNGGDPGALTVMAFTPDRRYRFVALINRGDEVGGEAIHAVASELRAFGDAIAR